MKAKDIKLAELVDFQDGKIDLHGRRLVLHSLHAFAQFRKDIVETAGMHNARFLFTRFGNYWGRADAAAMKRIFHWDSFEEWLMAGPVMHNIQGVCKPQVNEFSFDKENGRFFMNVVWIDSGEAEEHLIEFGLSKEPVCWMLTGYASGYASFCTGREIFFVEKTCVAKGDKICSAVGKDRESWGEEQIKPYMAFFKSEDIHKKIMILTEELKQKTKEIEQQREKIAFFEKKSMVLPAEVHSASFAKALDTASRAAPFDTSILITGESGSGKEVLARYIHKLSSRATAPFIVVNCAALPETLLESELFGHKAGSFTGASKDRIGLFEQAHRGTVFLDEIGEISPLLQTKLLRVLQEKEILRIGENTPRKVDIRIIAATNRDIKKAVAENKFREDLYYRLAVIEIEIPPLRERPEDILPLARHFVSKISEKLKIKKLRLDSSCLDYLVRYNWPGNVRELENAIERAAVLCRNNTIRPSDLPANIIHKQEQDKLSIPSPLLPISEIERMHIKNVIDSVKGNKSEAAKILGISYATLWRKLKETSR